MRPLSEHYHAYFFDIVGMGASSRHPFNIQTNEEAEKYFLDFIESWRIAVGLDQFIMVGHSFGGFLSGLYASHYP